MSQKTTDTTKLPGDEEPHLHICGENGAPCRGKLTHEEVAKLASLGTTPIKVAFGQGRYQGYRTTRDKYEKMLEIQDERIRHWRERAKTAETELRSMREFAAGDFTEWTGNQLRNRARYKVVPIETEQSVSHPAGCECGGFDRNGSHDAGEYVGYCANQPVQAQPQDDRVLTVAKALYNDYYPRWEPGELIPWSEAPDCVHENWLHHARAAIEAMQTIQAKGPVRAGDQECPACGTNVPAFIVGPDVSEEPYEFFSVSDTRDFVDSSMPRNYRAMVLALCDEIRRVSELATDSHEPTMCESCERVYNVKDMEYEPEDGCWFCKPCADGLREAEAQASESEQKNGWLRQ